MEEMIGRSDLVKKGKADSNLTHEIIVEITKNNLDKIEEELLYRSTLEHPKYAQWFTFDEIRKLIANEIGFNAVNDWLGSYNIQITWTSKRHEFIKCRGTISSFESLLNTTFYEWQELSSSIRSQPMSNTIILADNFSVPMHMASHIATIFNVCQAPVQLQKKTYRLSHGDIKETTKLRSKKAEYVQDIIFGHKDNVRLM